jgi:hypothetical protein
MTATSEPTEDVAFFDVNHREPCRRTIARLSGRVYDVRCSQHLASRRRCLFWLLFDLPLCLSSPSSFHLCQLGSVCISGKFSPRFIFFHHDDWTGESPRSRNLGHQCILPAGVPPARTCWRMIPLSFTAPAGPGFFPPSFNHLHGQRVNGVIGGRCLDILGVLQVFRISAPICERSECILVSPMQTPVEKAAAAQ